MHATSGARVSANASARCMANRLAVSSPKHDGEVRDDDGDSTSASRVGDPSGTPQPRTPASARAKSSPRRTRPTGSPRPSRRSGPPRGTGWGRRSASRWSRPACPSGLNCLDLRLAQRHQAISAAANTPPMMMKSSTKRMRSTRSCSPGHRIGSCRSPHGRGSRVHATGWSPASARRERPGLGCPAWVSTRPRISASWPWWWPGIRRDLLLREPGRAGGPDASPPDAVVVIDNASTDDTAANSPPGTRSSPRWCPVADEHRRRGRIRRRASPGLIVAHQAPRRCGSWTTTRSRRPTALEELQRARVRYPGRVTRRRVAGRLARWPRASDEPAPRTPRHDSPLERRNGPARRSLPDPVGIVRVDPAGRRGDRGRTACRRPTTSCGTTTSSTPPACCARAWGSTSPPRGSTT
jgi:hypothetical protein